jgi:hypothetical protein
MLQDMFEINLEKRAKTIFVPMNGKQMITLIDDMNMPNKVKLLGNDNNN